MGSIGAALENYWIAEVKQVNCSMKSKRSERFSEGYYLVLIKLLYSKPRWHSVGSRSVFRLTTSVKNQIGNHKLLCDNENMLIELLSRFKLEHAFLVPGMNN